jgi:ApaG protein
MSNTSEATTSGIRIRVESFYVPDRSDPEDDAWFFGYRVTIHNEGEDVVQLLARHWVITDGEGRVEEVRGPGVIGEQPWLRPGESFQYVSACPLTTAFGTMQGSYTMVTDAGDRFEAEIAPFALSEPFAVN